MQHLSDKQMKILNPLIRKAIYNSLIAIVNYPTHPFNRRIDWNLKIMPNYWELPELTDEYKEALSKMAETKIVFQSEFLNNEYQIGNIYSLPGKQCIILKGAYAFVGVKYEDRAKHRSKITGHLRKEGYIYSAFDDGYIKT
ncbi:hypothetical protein D3C71_1264440 [compost metagenome]